MKRIVQLLLAAIVVATVPAIAQFSLAEIPFDSVDVLKFPDNIHLGEAAGVATNSRGDIFVYTRTGNPVMATGANRAFVHGGSRLFQFDRTGKFTREIGQGLYAFLFAEQVRVDPQDNIWVVDSYSHTVIKFDQNGQVQLLLGRKPESINVPTPPFAPPAPPARGAGPAPAPAAGREGGGGGGGGGEGGGRITGPPGTGAPQDVFNRPTDVAWDAQGNIFISDGLAANARVAKFDRNGKFIKSWGIRGSGPGQFINPKGVAVDAQGNVYVADMGNRRIQVFDNEGTFKTQFINVGIPRAICITPGPRQSLFASNSNPPDDIDVDGEIYKMDLTGKLVGRFGRAGKLMKEFGTVNSIDCRTENDLYVGEIGNWRVQKLTLRAK
ncbi:MAG: peptidyl-alpha-hydroxyglycine alpha-amidating lyase family protein [Vicinamibacterales bacterium]|nr:peptidyl-alpha-hydroxyglycine alpha-amidating lyase family protein [Vicinamibacterales bacterium]